MSLLLRLKHISHLNILVQHIASFPTIFPEAKANGSAQYT